jgi:hypothetical protein
MRTELYLIDDNAIYLGYLSAWGTCEPNATFLESRRKEGMTKEVIAYYSNQKTHVQDQQNSNPPPN